MSLPLLDFALTEPPLRRRHHVQATSVQAYRQLDSHGRMASAVGWLIEMTKWWRAPTSAELAGWRWRDAGFSGEPSTTCLLYIRAGLSDAKRQGLVEHAGKRRCSVSGKVSLTWRVKTR